MINKARSEAFSKLPPLGHTFRRSARCIIESGSIIPRSDECNFDAPPSSRVLPRRSTTRIVRLIDRVNVFDAFQSAAWLIIPRASLSSNRVHRFLFKSRHTQRFFVPRSAPFPSSFFEIITKEAKEVVHFRGKSLNIRGRKSWQPYCYFFSFGFHAIPFYLSSSTAAQLHREKISLIRGACEGRIRAFGEEGCIIAHNHATRKATGKGKEEGNRGPWRTGN